MLDVVTIKDKMMELVKFVDITVEPVIMNILVYIVFKMLLE